MEQKLDNWEIVHKKYLCLKMVTNERQRMTQIDTISLSFGIKIIISCSGMGIKIVKIFKYLLWINLNLDDNFHRIFSKSHPQ